MQAELSDDTKPPITLIDTEAETLADLALQARERASLAGELLWEEVNRADTATLADLPDDVVTMMSSVDFVDETTGEEHSVQLVYPRDANLEQNRISVLTPVGAALIGMRRGNAISWPNRQGTHRSLRIVNVVQPAR